MAYEVKLDIYEGPIGILLSLIQARSLDVNQISLNELVTSFLAEIELRRALDLEVATEFLLVAATLMEIKCRRLLPGSEDDDQDEDDFFDERDVLIARLLEAKAYRDVSAVFAAMLEEGIRRVGRRVGFGPEVAHLVPDPLASLTAERLAEAYVAVLGRNEEPEMPPTHVTPLPRISVAEARRRIAEHLARTRRATFDEVVRDAEARLDVVVHFLGMLELFKLGEVDITQALAGAPIELRLLLESA
ncbi:MAG: ScpA family protein [Nitrospiraceae bacterium]|nr:ScpA family protein [Nitrospiraceae bacterium]